MHIHTNSFNMQAAGLSAAQELRAAEARRAADVRRKLLKSAAALEGGTEPEETVLISQWVDSAHGNAPGSSGMVRSDPDDF
jgi:hypothetical protein